MIVSTDLTIRRGLGRRPLQVRVIRRNCRRTRMTARRMAAAGRPHWWIARALGIVVARVAQLLAFDPLWGSTLQGRGSA